MAMQASLGGVALASVLSLAVMFLLTKLMGNKQVSQMTLFDYIVGITIGSVAAELATELENPERPLLAMLLWGLAAWGISLLGNKSFRARAFLSGKPLVLLDQGVIDRKNLKRARLDLNEFLTYCRIAGYFDLNEIQTAVLEHNGSVSFLPKETDRPATPADLDLRPRQSLLQIPFIMDGRLLPENIGSAGKEPSWVHRALLRQGYRDEREVLLALWDGGENEKLTVFPMSPRSQS